jgi:hypothetical protein
MLAKQHLYCTGDGVVAFASLIASEYVHARSNNADVIDSIKYNVELTPKGRAFVEAWKRGDHETAITALPFVSSGGATASGPTP